MKRLLVVGGGISGLALAWFLVRRGIEVEVLEADAEPGGSIRTGERDGFLFDTGPTSTLYRGGALAELIEALGLRSEIVEAPRRARRYIAKHGRLVALPANPWDFIATPLVSARAKWRLLTEPFRGRADQDESIAAFVRRRLGAEFLDWAVDPFVSGVYAGDPERLSVHSAMPRLYALEAEHGSLFKGALARVARGRVGAPQPAGRLISFSRGMQTLPRALAQALGERLHLSAAVTSIVREGDEWAACTATAVHRAPHLVLAVPTHRAAALLTDVAPAAARELAAISYPPVGSVALGFRREQIAHVLDGFGALLPRRLGCATLGVIFSSMLFPGRAPPGQVLLTAFIGGARTPAVREWPGAKLQATVLNDLRPLLGIRGEPVFTEVTRWPQAIPQYELGHAERLGRIDAAVAGNALHFCGNWRDGVSLADSVASAQRLAALLAGNDRL